MKTINLIIPYFGKFPSYYQLFLNSCKKNNTINWTIITDNDEEYGYPSNVKKVYMTFQNLVQNVQKQFDFKISLKTPYKLCDYKPTYGYLFPDIVGGYDYWGYSDLDVIYGDLRSFLLDNILEYDKIFILGHFSLIKNSKECNELFMGLMNGSLIYKKVFTSDEIFNFDETFLDKPNINMIFHSNRYRVFNDSFAADIYTKSSFFRLIDINQDYEKGKRINAFFLWNNGKLYRYIKTRNGIQKKEYMYVHLQKRKMRVNINDVSVYKIIPNSFDMLEVNVNQISKEYDNIKISHFNLQYFKIRSKNLYKKVKQKCRRNRGI